MKQQVVSGKPIGSLMGILLVIAIAAALLCVRILSALAVQLLGWSFLRYGVWLVAMLVVLLILRRYLTTYRYTLNEGTLYIERLTGNYGKVVLQADLVDIRSLDTLAAQEAAHPNVRVAERAVCARSPLPVYAIEYRTENGEALCAFQPDEDLRAAIRARRGIREDA